MTCWHFENKTWKKTENLSKCTAFLLLLFICEQLKDIFFSMKTLFSSVFLENPDLFVISSLSMGTIQVLVALQWSKFWNWLNNKQNSLVFSVLNNEMLFKIISLKNDVQQKERNLTCVIWNCSSLPRYH